MGFLDGVTLNDRMKKNYIGYMDSRDYRIAGRNVY